MDSPHKGQVMRKSFPCHDVLVFLPFVVDRGMANYGTCHPWWAGGTHLDVTAINLGYFSIVQVFPQHMAPLLNLHPISQTSLHLYRQLKTHGSIASNSGKTWMTWNSYSTVLKYLTQGIILLFVTRILQWTPLKNFTECIIHFVYQRIFLHMICHRIIKCIPRQPLYILSLTLLLTIGVSVTIFSVYNGDVIETSQIVDIDEEEYMRLQYTSLLVKHDKYEIKQGNVISKDGNLHRTGFPTAHGAASKSAPDKPDLSPLVPPIEVSGISNRHIPNNRKNQSNRNGNAVVIPNTKYFTPPVTSGPLVKPFQEPLEQNESKPKVLIYAKLRTGSTFASEFFNQNRNFFYTFEPLQLVNKSDRYVPVDWVAKALSCKFHDLWHAGLINPLHTNSSLPGWKRKIFCYKYDENDNCARAPISEIERNCSEYNALATKIISVPYIHMLVPLIEQGVKIIHLVRDPRGVESSRLRVMAGPKRNNTGQFILNHMSAVFQDTRLYCQQLRKDLNDMKLIFNSSEIPNSRYYTIVRYEDLAMDPVKELHRMYHTLRIPEDVSVNQWVSGLTNIPRNLTAAENEFGTFRINSAETAIRWRRHIPWLLVDVIQKECTDVMELLGYQRFRNQLDFEDYSYNVLKKKFMER